MKKILAYIAANIEAWSVLLIVALVLTLVGTLL